jgi:hypothetical protein
LAFPREDNVTKDTIQDFEIVFFVPGPDNVDGVQSGRIDVQIFLSSDESFNRQYNLLARLQDDAAGLVHLSNLADLRDYIKARLDAEVLPL